MMKALFLFLTFLFPLAGITQTTEFRISLANDALMVSGGDPGKVVLPVKFILSHEFAQQKIRITDHSRQEVLALNGSALGEGLLMADSLDGTYSLTISSDRRVTPGRTKINVNRIVLEIGTRWTGFAIDTSGVTGDTREVTNEPARPAVQENYEAGYIYYDALKLADEATNVQTVKEILAAWQINEAILASNPYLLDILGTKYFPKNEAHGGAAGVMLSSLGNTDVTQYAAGLARFLAERMKDELNEAFFKKMKEQLNAFPEIGTVFPNTTGILQAIENYSYASVLQVLKEAFETDARNLPANLYELKSLTPARCLENELSGKKLSSCQDRLAKLEKFFATREGHWLGVGLFTLKSAFETSNPADLINLVAESGDLHSLKEFAAANALFSDYNAAATIELGNLFSQSLLSRDEARVWITAKELGFLVKDTRRIKAYLGLLLVCEQTGRTTVQFYKDAPPPVTFGTLLRSVHKSYSAYEPDIISLLKETCSAYNAANSAVKQMTLAMEDSKPPDPRALYDYYHAFEAALKPIANNQLLADLITKDLAEAYIRATGYIDPSIDLAYHVSAKEYTSALFDAVILLNHVKNYDKNFNEVSKSFVRYGTLISSVATAQNSDEVKKALEASVLPVGSSSIKRNSNWSLSLNAYVGGYYGKAYTTLERKVQAVSDTAVFLTEKKDTSYKTFGLYAPIGLAVSKGTRCGLGMSVFVQVIDLGALVNFYMVNGDETALPSEFKVRLSNIFAPGIQLGLNIPRTPLTLTGGIQYVPALYQTNQVVNDAQITAMDAWRIHGSIVVDIPLFNVKVWDFRK